MGVSGINARILKVTSLFGGLQGANLVCSVIRLKLVAIWIGAAGIGLFGLLNSALETIFTLTQLGIRQSAVRDLAAANHARLPHMVCAVRRWSLVLGIAGGLLTIGLSPWLSYLTFGDKSRWWMFAALSVTVLFSAVNNGEGAVFQGMQRFRKLAACTLAGTIGGLAISIPMFYVWRIDSIVPSFIAYSACTWLAMGLYREKVPPPSPGQSFKETMTIGRGFLTLGIYMTVTAASTSLISYIFMAYLNHEGTLDTTGYYNAGFTILNKYAGLVFTAIAMEYFPRLSAVASSRMRTSLFVSNQIRISLAIVVPMAALFIACSEWIVTLLYNNDFTIIKPFVIWGFTGTVLRAVSWCMSFVILAKGDGRIFMFTELASCIAALTLNIIGYRYGGFAGLGYAYCGWYVIYTIIIGTVYTKRYDLSIDKRLYAYIAYGLLITICAATLYLAVSPLGSILVAAVACAVSARTLQRL